MVTQYFALLALGSFAATLTIFASALTVRGRTFWQTNLGPFALYAAATVAVVTTAGSLYLSEGLNYLPCRLCWAQRAMAYPLALVLLVGALLFRPRWLWVVFPFASVGALIATYHIGIERSWWPESSTSCDPNNPCSLIWVQHYRFVTIPVMALGSFLLQLALAWIGLMHDRNTQRLNLHGMVKESS
jgi:disulfide bond formation protein DsbB